ncbi:P-loop NTPase family protein [Aestuariimicrobium ganziense]|uniref:ATP-binding protein n=1 Tax=Aestuariimicrobium ganziense TaxID=2773677 RepID=UPI001941B6B5|nr:ATP-binding protein [Aestuariimicrobium ganziense]
MTITTRFDYENALQALGICVSARIPALLWGNPGEGKTAAVEAVTDQGWHVETVIITHSEPSDFAGLPVVTPDGSVNLAPPGWAKRLAEHDGPSIAFFDEFSTASPALQAAALRPLTHYQVGNLVLPDSVSFVAAANPADVAAAGWELAAPTASRFVHLDWALPHEVYAESLVTGQWPTMPVHQEPADYQRHLDRERVFVSGFLRIRPSLLSAIPGDTTDRGRAFPTPRTWDYAARLAAFARAVGAGDDVRRLLVEGCLGSAAAFEYLRWASVRDLPDPDDLLSNPMLAAFHGVRPDRVYVVLQSVLAAVVREPTPERWTAALDVCGIAAKATSIDPAVPVVRALMRPEIRPVGCPVPSSIKVFAPALALAGLLPGAA